MIVEQTVFHFLCKDIPPPSVSTLTDDDVIYAVNRLHNLFVRRSHYNEYKRQIKSLIVHDDKGNEVPVLDFKSFKDGRTALENAQCLKKTPGDKYDKVIDIIESIKKVKGSDADASDTWREVDSCKENNLKYKVGDKLVLNNFWRHKFTVEGCNKDGYIEHNGEDPHTKKPIIKIHPESTISHKALFNGGKKTKRSSFRYKKRSSKSKKLKKRNKITKKR